jgi:hypothetical protein
MKILGVIGTAVLFLLLVTTAPVYAQDRDEAKPDEAKPAHQQDEKAKPEDKAKREEGKHQEEQPGARQDERRGHPEATNPQEEKKEQREQRRQQRMDRDQQQHRAHAQGGKHIPDEKFRSSFGRQHTFKVQRTQIVNSPQPVVVYGGYSFQLVDPWPAEWAFDDDCYIEYVDGQYFLFDAFHPETSVTVFVVE